MTTQIFCPSNHLILDAPVCPECGWQRPPAISQGSLLWKPLNFPCGIGGPAQESFFRPGIADGVGVFPLRSGELVGINQQDGRILWQTAPSPELFPRKLFTNHNTLIGVVADDRSLEKAGNGYLAGIDPHSGETGKIWEGYGFTMTDPVFDDRFLYTRTARPRLVILDRLQMNRVIREIPLKTYKPIPPVPAGELILVWDGEVTKEEMILKAFEVKTGNLVWQSNIEDIDCSPLVCDNLFIYRTAKRQLTAVDIRDGKELWKKKFEKIYSGLFADGNRLYVIIRDLAEGGEESHYTLTCLNPVNGEFIWKKPLGIRAQNVQLLPDGRLFLGMGDPGIAVCSAQDGTLLWEYSFGEEKINRVQTSPVIRDGICWLGTYEGTVAAVQLVAANIEAGDPEGLLQEGKFEEAACAFALKGDYTASAAIFEQKLDQPQKALALYRKADNVESLVRVHLTLGNERSAAEDLEKSGRLKDAAVYFEKAGEPRKALEIYKQLGEKKEVTRLRGIVPPVLSDIEELASEKKFPEAGFAAMKLREFEKAHEYFEQAGEEFRAQTIDALKELCSVNPEPWSLDKLADLARKQENFAVQAFALEKLGNNCEAAQAYMKAAAQMEETQSSEKTTILKYYEVANSYFEQEGMLEMKKQSSARIRFLRRLPNIQVQNKTGKSFKQGEKITLNLDVHNVGFGRADSIHLHVEGTDYQKNNPDTPGDIQHLGVNEHIPVTYSFRPSDDKFFGGTPFSLQWSWKDKDGNGYHEGMTIFINVDESRESPIIINNAEHVFTGDARNIQGDVIESGGHKGDQIIREGSNLRVIDSEYGDISDGHLLIKCPSCGQPVEKDADFCIRCGYRLKP